MAQSNTVRIRCRTRRAVSGRSTQIGDNAVSTSPDSIRSNRGEPKTGNTCFSSVPIHCAACFSFRNVVARDRWTSRAASSKVGTVVAGKPPAGRRKSLQVDAYPEVPGFIAELRDAHAGKEVRLAFEFLILTAARTSEVLLATWDEVDLGAKSWTVPARADEGGAGAPLTPGGAVRGDS